MLRCLTNERSSFSIAVARYKISFQICNKIACHSVPSSCVPSTCLYLVTSFKESKKQKKKLRLHWNCHRSTPPVNGYNIIPPTRTDGGERAVGRGSMKLLICYLRIVWIKVRCIHNGSVHIAEEISTWNEAERRTRKSG